MNFKVNDIFCSIQGEGLFVGKPMNFIRFTKCNLSCDWCDTDFSEGVEMSAIGIIEKLNDKISWISLTGGEPMMEENLLFLIDKLKERNYKIYLETNGTKFDEKIFEKLDFLSIDLKAPSSGNSVYEKKTFHYAIDNQIKSQFKVVLKNTDDDLLFFENLYKGEYKNYENWIIQPEWDSKIDFCLLVKKFPDVRIIPQVHKIMKVE